MLEIVELVGKNKVMFVIDIVWKIIRKNKERYMNKGIKIKKMCGNFLVIIIIIVGNKVSLRCFY